MGANWNLPVLSSLYTDVLSMFRDRDVDSLTLQITPASNPPTGAFQFDRVNNYFAEFDGVDYVPKILSVEGGGTGSSTVAGVIASFGLGSMSLQDSNNVTITGGNITGITNLSATNLIISGSVAVPNNSIPEVAILDGAILARVASNELITGNWSITGNWTHNSGNFSFNSGGTFSVANSNWALFDGTDAVYIRKTVGLRLENPCTRIFFKGTGTADRKNWSFDYVNDLFTLYAVNDAENTFNPVFTVSRVAFSPQSWIFGVVQVVFPAAGPAAPSICGADYPTTGIYWYGHTQLGASCAITNQAGTCINTFNSSGLEIKSGGANLVLYTATAPLNSKNYQFYVDTNGTCTFQCVTDNYSGAAAIFTVSRTGTTINSFTFHCPVSITIAGIVITSSRMTVGVPIYGRYYHGAAGTAYSYKFDYPSAEHDGILHTNGQSMILGVGFNGTDSGLNTSGAWGSGTAIYMGQGVASGGSSGSFYINCSSWGVGAKSVYHAVYDNSYAGIHLIADYSGTLVCGYTGNFWHSVWAVNGTIQTSDIEQKDEIKPIRSGLNLIKALNPIEFKWKDEDIRKRYKEAQLNIDERDENDLDRIHFGFSGQELLERLPFRNGIVYDNGKAINYSNLVAFLVKAIQELSEKVETLENKT